MQVFRCNFVQMYGMTETSGAIVALAPADHDIDYPELLRSAGRPLPGVELAILGSNGVPAPKLQVGEIAIRSVGNMAGYWKQPAATAEVLSSANWLRSGDLGYLDEDGYLFIQDRLKDMIVTGGENVYPAEVEKAFASHPAVAEVAVIAVPSVKWGEEVKAVVVVRPGNELDEADLIAWARGRLAGYKVPKSVDFVASIPRNASSKIMRRLLREPYWRGTDREVN
jgi:acyl-CoA synthetase (AMP-forming)/AMP-acid ligase II